MVRPGGYSLCRPVVQVKEGRVVEQWGSRAECARALNIDTAVVGRMICGKQRNVWNLYDAEALNR